MKQKSHRPPCPKMPLDSIGACRHELASMYRLAKGGKLPWKDLTRAVVALQAIARMIESADFERRLSALEAAEAEDRPGTRPNGRHAPLGRL